jgi:hypothetical protein
MHGLIGHSHMQGAGIGIGIDGDGGDTHPARCLHDPTGDLAPVRDQDLFEHVDCLTEATRNGNNQLRGPGRRMPRQHVGDY